MNDLEIRRQILRHFADTGKAPTAVDVEAWGVAEGSLTLQRLHEVHAVVLDQAGRIMLANPFSGVPTPWVVRTDHRSWYANCAWDAIAIPIALRRDARIEAPWMDEPSDVDLAVVGGQVTGGPGFVHFQVPAAHWWDDIVHT